VYERGVYLARAPLRLQLRDSAGLSPASPRLAPRPPIRGLRASQRMEIGCAHILHEEQPVGDENEAEFVKFIPELSRIMGRAKIENVRGENSHD